MNTYVLIVARRSIVQNASFNSSPESKRNFMTLQAASTVNQNKLKIWLKDFKTRQLKLTLNQNKYRNLFAQFHTKIGANVT